MPPEPDSVAVLIVSYNTRSTTLACLGALRESRGVRLHVIVADNGSRDGSADAIAAEHPEVELIRCGANLGFGRASNLAFARARADHVLLVNADCLVAPSTIAGCLEFLKGRSTITAVAPQLRYPDGSVQRSCRRFPGPLGEFTRMLMPFQVLRHLPLVGSYYMGGWGHDDTRPVDQPAGAFLLMRYGGWGDGPPFDERFFMYFEDVDLCRRLWKKGPIWFLADVQAVHLGEHSTSQVRVSMAAALATSRYQYFAKWHGIRVARLVTLLGAVASGSRAIAWRVVAAARPGIDARSRATAHRTAARTALRMLVDHGPRT